jgi:excinuclease ABC subunit B
MTESMQRTIDETNRRREIQIAHNTQHGIVPKTVRKSIEQIMKQTSVLDIKGFDENKANAIRADIVPATIAAEDADAYNTIPKMEKAIAKVKKEMEKAARDLDFIEAARLRDEMFRMQQTLEEMKA